MDSEHPFISGTRVRWPGEQGTKRGTVDWWDQDGDEYVIREDRPSDTPHWLARAATVRVPTDRVWLAA